MEEPHSQSGGEISRALKRPCDQSSFENEIRKRRKNEPAPSKLVDVNDDCLRSIFQFLGALDLINVAEADDRFVPVAAEIFRRHIQGKVLKVVRNPSRCVQNDCIKMNMEVASTCFRHFGSLISDLSIDFDGKQESEIEQSLLMHCRKSLRYLDLYRCQSGSLETMKRPFVNVEELRIMDSMLGRKMSKLNIWFPNLVSLELNNTEAIYPEFIEENFSKLENLSISCRTPNRTVALLLVFNPQLKSLNLYDFSGYYAAKLIEIICTSLVELKQLTMFPGTDRELTQTEISRLLAGSRNLKQLNVTFGQQPPWITELFEANWAIEIQHA